MTTLLYAGQRQLKRKAQAQATSSEAHTDNAADAESAGQLGEVVDVTQDAESRDSFWADGPSQLVRFAPELVSMVPTHGPALLDVHDIHAASSTSIPRYQQLICPRLTMASMPFWVKDASKCRRLLTAVDHLHDLVTQTHRSLTVGQCLRIVFQADMASMAGDAQLVARGMQHAAA